MAKIKTSNIGVFGDSFAHRFDPRKRHNRHDLKTDPEYLERLLKAFPTWMEFIRNDKTSVTSHALSGTDIIWSFIQFEKYQESYDKIIFILTSPGRISIRFDFGKYFNGVSDIRRPLSSTTGQRTKQLQDKFRDDMSEQGRELYNACCNLEKWHELCTMDGFLERECIAYNLVIERIKQLRPDVKFIRAFSDFPKFWLPPDGAPDYIHGTGRYVRMGTSLHDILQAEDKIMEGYNPTDRYYGNDDMRQCHLTCESHKILAEQIKKWLKNNELFLDINLLEFEGINPDLKKYFVNKHKTFDDWLKYNIK